MELTQNAYLVLLPVALAAGLVRGFAGFGGPLVMIPFLNLYLPPAASIWVMMWIDVLVNVRLVPPARHQTDRTVLIPLLAGVLATMPLGVQMIATTDPLVMKRVIGATIFLAAVVLLSGWRYPHVPGRATWIGAGLLSGLIIGATSIAVTLALFLNASRQSAAQSRANFIICAFVAVMVQLALLVLQKAIRPGFLVEIAILAPPYLLGTGIGAQLQGRAPDTIVRRVVLLLAAVIGAASALL